MVRFSHGLFLKCLLMRSPRFLLACVLASLATCSGSPALAQINPDQTLGAEASIVTTDRAVRGALADLIEGGAVRGTNLFHSFSDFNVLENQRVYFANPAGIASILSRVTGDRLSSIFGTLGVDGSANLLLINPNGIVFGSNVSLDVEGSFYATTAESIPIGAYKFSATAPEQSRLLAIKPDTSFFNYLTPHSGNIINSGHISAGGGLILSANSLDLQGQIAAGGDLSLLATDDISIQDAVNSPFVGSAGGNLLLQGNQQVNLSALTHPESGLFSAGDMTLRSSHQIEGDAHYSSGGDFRIEDLEHRASGLSSTDDPIIFANGDITFGSYTGASLHIITGGSVAIDQILITDRDLTGSSISPTTFPELSNIKTSNGQTLVIDGSAQPTLDIRAGVDWSQLNENFTDQNIGVTVPPEFIASSGSNADISVGNIRINTPNGLVFLSNQFSPNLALPGGDIRVSTIFTGDIEGLFQGDSGDVLIDSRDSVAVENFISTVSTLRNGGDITLIAEDLVSLRDGFISTAISGAIDGTTNLENRSAGDIAIASNSLSLRNGQIMTETFGAGNAGDLTVKTRDSVEVIGSPGSSTRISTDVKDNGAGAAGDLTIDTQRLLVENAQVSASIQGIGDVGVLKIVASDWVELRGEVRNQEGFATNPGGLLAQIDVNDEGNSGVLTVETNLLNVSNGSKIQVGTFGDGDAGELTIDAAEINLFNTNSPLYLTGIFAGVLQDPRSSTRLPTGGGGKINIYTDRLAIRDGARVTADVSGIGGDGDIFIRANELIEVVGIGTSTPSLIGAEVDPPGVGVFVSPGQNFSQGGSLTLQVRQLKVRDGGRISVATFGNGDSGSIQIQDSQLVEIAGQSFDGSPSSISAEAGEASSGSGGNIAIDTQQLVLANGGEINARSEGTGRAGDITLRLDGGNLTIENSEIKTSSVRSLGGDIDISAGTIRLEGDGDIQTDVRSGEGSGGNINIVANSIIAFDDSDILAFSTDGRGGNIVLNTPAFFGENYVANSPSPFDDNDRVDINASGRLASGIVFVPSVDFIENGLIDLPDNLTNVEALVVASCIVNAEDTTGSLTLIGGDRLPQSPNDTISEPYTLGTVQSVTPTAADPSAMIREPQAVYRLPDGRLAMSRNCQR